MNTFLLFKFKTLEVYRMKVFLLFCPSLEYGSLVLFLCAYFQEMPCGVMVSSTDSGATGPGFESCFCSLLVT